MPNKPALVDKRIFWLHIRVNIHEYERIKTFCRLRGVKVSETVRKAVKRYVGTK